MAKYDEHPVDAEGWTKYIKPIMKGYKIACCDCGLVHKFEFKIIRGRVFYRAARDNRATAAKRRKS